MLSWRELADKEIIDNFDPEAPYWVDDTGTEDFPKNKYGQGQWPQMDRTFLRFDESYLLELLHWEALPEFSATSF